MPRTRLAAVLLLSVVGVAPGFSAGTGIVGLVVDGAGKPVPGAEVRALPERGLAGLPSELGEAQRTRTGASGRFHLPLTPGSYDLAASHPGFSPALGGVLVRAGKTPEVRLVLGKSHSVSGTVTDSAGKPVPGAEVELTRVLHAGDRWSQQSPPDQGLYRARTDPAGRFEVRDLPASWFDLRVEHPDFVPLERPGIVVEDGTGRIDVGRLPLRAGRTVAGVVVDDKGLPLANTEIWVREDASSAAEDHALHERGPRQVTGPDGRFSIPHLAENGGLFLYACRHDRSQFQQDLDQPLPEPFRIVMPSSGRLPGRVVDADGHPVPGAQVGALLTGFTPSDVIYVDDPCPWLAENASATTDAEGRFVLEPLASGVFRVWASADGFLRYDQRRMELGGKNGPRSLDVVLQRGASLTGQVRMPDGSPASGVSISADCSSSNPTSTDAAGRYRLEGLPPGATCTLSTGGGKFRWQEKRFEVEPGENRLDLQVELDPRTETVEIHGRVTGPQDEPVAGAEVGIGSFLFPGESVSTGPDGSFVAEMEGTSGEHRVSVRKQGYAPSPSITVDGQREVVIRLEREVPLTGRLHNLDPEEIAQASVTAKGADPSFFPRSFVDPDGTYRVADLGPGEWTVTAQSGGRSATAQVTLRSGEKAATLDLSFPGRYPVRGRVLDPDGEGVAGATVAFVCPVWQYATTREDGTFEILLQDDSYPVHVRGGRTLSAPEGFGEVVLDRPVVVAGAPVEGLEIHLPRGLVLHGCVPGLLPGERPSITISGPKTVGLPRIGPDGCYRSDDLGPGDWKVTARLEDVYPDGETRQIERRVTLSPEAPETEVDLDLALGDRTLTIHPAGPGKLAGLHLKLFRTDGTTVVESQSLGVDSAFHIGRLQEGSYRVQIRDEHQEIRLDEPVDLSTDRDLVVEVP